MDWRFDGRQLRLLLEAVRRRNPIPSNTDKADQL
jgi:hypothetical protein